MASYGRAGPSSSTPYAPSAPSLPESYGQEQHQYQQQYNNQPSPTSTYYGQQPPTSAYYGQQQVPSSSSYGYSSSSSSSSYYSFPPGTHPDVIRSFEVVDRDRSGFIDEVELQQALSSGYQRFRLRTIRLLIFLFKNPRSDSLKIGPAEFAALWSCLGQWRAIFERYDQDRSGKIDGMELRDALYGIGYAVPASVLQVLISHYGDGSGRKADLDFDGFVECGMIVKGLTEKFKEKDSHYTGTATFSYDGFMTMVLPFLVSYN